MASKTKRKYAQGTVVKIRKSWSVNWLNLLAKNDMRTYIIHVKVDGIPHLLKAWENLPLYDVYEVGDLLNVTYKSIDSKECTTWGRVSEEDTPEMFENI